MSSSSSSSLACLELDWPVSVFTGDEEVVGLKLRFRLGFGVARTGALEIKEGLSDSEVESSSSVCVKGLG
jgi:hypothetical protein